MIFHRALSVRTRRRHLEDFPSILKHGGEIRKFLTQNWNVFVMISAPLCKPNPETVITSNPSRFLTFLFFSNDYCRKFSAIVSFMQITTAVKQFSNLLETKQTSRRHSNILGNKLLKSNWEKETLKLKISKIFSSLVLLHIWETTANKEHIFISQTVR